MRSGMLFSAVLVFSLWGCGGAAPVEPEATDSLSEALLDAPVDRFNRFAVGLCAGPVDAQGSCTQINTRCSGTLIAPNLVLTARHCIHKPVPAPVFCDGTFSQTPLTAEPLRVTLSPSAVAGHPVWREVAEVLLAPGNNGCRDDVALVVLNAPAYGVPNVHLSLSRDLVVKPPQSIAVVGRGVVGEKLDLTTFQFTYEQGDMRRRILRNLPFVCAKNGAEVCTVEDFSSPPTNSFDAPSSLFIVGKGLASGDSGSGIYDNAFFDVYPRLIGVTSATTFGADGVPNFGLVTRLDIHADFIEQGLATAASRLQPAAE